MAWWLSPPLGAGSPRAIVSADVAERHYAQALPEGELRSGLMQEAVAGWEQGRGRLAGVESRAGLLLGATGLTSSLLLANAGTLIGPDAIVNGTARRVAIVSLAIATALLAVAGLYGLCALFVTFGRIPPDGVDEVLKRAAMPPAEAERSRVGRLCASRLRAAIVTEWKLARLKRAAASFVAGVVMLQVTVAPVLIDRW